MADQDQPLTAAELLRRKAQRNRERSDDGEKKRPFASKDIDIDEEIEQLERELNDNSSSSASSSDSEDGSDVGGNLERSKDAMVTVSLSKHRGERIEPLPAHCLPAPSTSVSGKGRYTDGAEHRHRNKRQKQETIDPDIKSSVQAILQEYVPRSRDRLPFYCRYCQRQYSNEDEFFRHRSEPFHQAAVEAERKATYCKLCRKQMTSPAQMKEHLSSKPHKELLEYRKGRQAGGGGGGGVNGGRTRDGGGRGGQHDRSKMIPHNRHR